MIFHGEGAIEKRSKRDASSFQGMRVNLGRFVLKLTSRTTMNMHLHTLYI